MFMPRTFWALFLVFMVPTVRPPCVLHLESLQYSQAARMAKIQGKVSVAVELSPTGTVTSVAATSGPAILRRDAEDNLKKWRFNGGEKTQIEIVYEFRLEEPEVDYIPATRMIFDLPNRVLVMSNLPKPND
jgi:TonB family protein